MALPANGTGDQGMRLFVGTALPADVAHGLHASLGDRLAAAPWRMAPLPQWHVTALFIGVRPVQELDAIAEVVRRQAAMTPAIELRHGRVVTMPEHEPHMLWLRFDPSPALTALHHALARAVQATPSPHHPYWPHVTMARSRSRAPVLPPEPPLLDRLVLEQLTLFRSDPGPQGTIHTPLFTAPLS
jgi:2'-5' RNA ligase